MCNNKKQNFVSSATLASKREALSMKELIAQYSESEMQSGKITTFRAKRELLI